jgi:hypothetical protein
MIFFHAPISFWVLFGTSMVFVGYLSFMFFRSCLLLSCNHRHLQVGHSRAYDSIDELTFISAPRPNLRLEAYNRTKLAISSWLSASPYSNVLLFVNRTSYKTLIDELEILYEPGRVICGRPIKTDLAGTPYIDDWFQEGIRLSPSTYVCFINADILISRNWLIRAKEIFAFHG